MLKKTRFFPIVTLACLTLFLLPGVALAAPRQAATHTRSTASQTYTVHLAFSGLITKGSGVGTLVATVSAGLTLHIQQDGSFTGTEVIDYGVVAPVKGQFQPDGDMHFTTFMPGSTIVKHPGHINQSGEAVGTFQFFYHGKPGPSGIWSAQVVSDVDHLLTFGLGAQETKGPDAGLIDSEALVLNKSTLRGISIDALGPIYAASAQFAHGNLLLILDFGHGLKVFATGTPVTSHGVTSYKGTFVGPRKGDAGKFFALPFSFAS
jgi:hypothetical protein